MPVRSPERVIFCVFKDSRLVRGVVRELPHGRELCVLLGDGELLFTRLVRPSDQTTIDAEAAAARDALIGAGWRDSA